MDSDGNEIEPEPEYPSDSDHRPVSKIFESWIEAAIEKLRLPAIRNLSDMRMYNNPELAARMTETDGHTYEIPLDIFHLAICQELPRRRNFYPDSWPGRVDERLTVGELCMDDQSYDRYLH
jgi:hypothetical protein